MLSYSPALVSHSHNICCPKIFYIGYGHSETMSNKLKLSNVSGT